MIPEMYMWLEQYSGITFSFEEDIKRVSDNYAFEDPFDWYTTISNVLDGLNEALGVIDKYSLNIPDYLPPKPDFKKAFSEYVIGNIVFILNKIKSQLHIQDTTIDSVDALFIEITGLFNLITFLIQYPLEDIIKHKMFDNINEESNELLSSVFGITAGDITDMHFTVSTIRESLSDDDN